MVLKIRGVLRGSHVHAQVFMGPQDGNVACCGELTLRKDEFECLRETLITGSVVATCEQRGARETFPDPRPLVAPVEHVIFEVEGC